MENRYEKVSLQAFDTMIQDHKSTLRDVRANFSRLDYLGSGAGTLANGFETVGVKATETGYMKMCQRMGAPYSWLRSERCPEDLEVTIVNRLKREVRDDQLFRLRKSPDDDGYLLRSVLSKQYRVFDHHQVWEVVKNTLESNAIAPTDPVIWKPSVSDSMNVWVLFDNVLADPTDNSGRSYDGGGYGGLKPAIHIKNAEDGTGGVNIASGLYRSYCANGVIFGYQNDIVMRKIHKGSHYEMVGAVMGAMTYALRMSADGIRAYIQAMQVELNKELDDIVDVWGKKYAFGVHACELWASFLKDQDPQTVADLAMATSDFAGRYPDSKVGTEFERLAGDLITARRI